MSVTFSLNITDADFTGSGLWCVADLVLPHESGVFPFEQAAALAVVHQEQCVDSTCRQYGPSVMPAMSEDAHNELSVNVANGNASTLFEVLGIMIDPAVGMVGSTSADDFLGRVRIAQALVPADAGIPTAALAVEQAQQHRDPLVRAFARIGSVVQCGRPEGYIESRLDELATLAEAGRASGRAICWA